MNARERWLDYLSFICRPRKTLRNRNPRSNLEPPWRRETSPICTMIAGNFRSGAFAFYDSGWRRPQLRRRLLSRASCAYLASSFTRSTAGIVLLRCQPRQIHLLSISFGDLQISRRRRKHHQFPSNVDRRWICERDEEADPDLMEIVKAG